MHGSTFLCVLLAAGQLPDARASRSAPAFARPRSQACCSVCFPWRRRPQQFSLRLVPVVLLSLVVRGFVMPHFLWRAVRGAGVRRELQPSVGFVFSLFAGVALLVLCFLIARPLQDARGGGATLALARGASSRC